MEVVENSRHFFLGDNDSVPGACSSGAWDKRVGDIWTDSSSKWCLPATGAICWITSSIQMVFPRYFLSQCHSLSQPVISLRRDSSVPPLGARALFAQTLDPVTHRRDRKAAWCHLQYGAVCPHRLISVSIIPQEGVGFCWHGEPRSLPFHQSWRSVVCSLFEFLGNSLNKFKFSSLLQKEILTSSLIFGAGCCIVCLEPCAVLNLCGPWTFVCCLSLFVEGHVGTGGGLESERRLLGKQPHRIANFLFEDLEECSYS